MARKAQATGLQAASLPIYQVDAFTSELFRGNPAAVVPLDSWRDDAWMQAVAAENNLSETAFFVPTEDGYHLRWFTPTDEIWLCGHATLASALVIMTVLQPDSEQVAFTTQRRGTLTVTRRDDGGYEMDFPAREAHPVHDTPEIDRHLGGHPSVLLSDGQDWLAVFDDPAFVADLVPDIAQIRDLPCKGVIITAPGGPAYGGADFVSRYFAPNFGVDEDPVTGSAHCMLAPYWGDRLGKRVLQARQLYPGRGGEVACTVRGDRVLLGGHGVLYLEGRIAA